MSTPEKVMTFYRNSTDGEGGLRKLAEIARGASVADVGANMGESAIIFRDYFASVYSIDTWSEREISESRESAKYKMTAGEIEVEFDKRMNLSRGRICKLKMDSTHATDRFSERFFDLVYLDAGHHYDSVMQDMRSWLPKAKYYIGGHDFTDGMEVQRAVLNVFGMPHWLFEDSSWLIKIDWLRLDGLTNVYKCNLGKREE